MPALGFVAAKVVGAGLYGAITFKRNASARSAEVCFANPWTGGTTGVKSASLGFERTVINYASSHQPDGTTGTTSSTPVVVGAGISTVHGNFGSGG